jgi:hypothetical protein
MSLTTLTRNQHDVSSIWGRTNYHLRRIDEDRTIAHAWPEETLFVSMFCACATGNGTISALVGPFSPEMTVTWTEEALSGITFIPILFFPYFLFPVLFSPYFLFPVLLSPVIYFSYYFPVIFSRTFFSRNFFFSYCFPVYIFSYFFSPYFFLPYYFPVLFKKRDYKRFNISVSCFSSTCRYNTVHVHCGISIQTSPVGLPLDGWGARMRDLKGPKMNLFNLKEDWNVFLYQPIISLEIEPIRSRYFRPIRQSDCKNWTNQKRADL